MPGVLFEELGFKYLGPVDGHDIGQLEQMLTSAQEYDRPVFVHVVTRKGKGYERAEIFPERYHGVAPFFIDTGMKEKDQSITFSATFGQHLTKMAMHNEKIIAISAAMVEGTGLTPFRQMFPQPVSYTHLDTASAITKEVCELGMPPEPNNLARAHLRYFIKFVNTLRICASIHPRKVGSTTGFLKNSVKKSTLSFLLLLARQQPHRQFS